MKQERGAILAGSLSLMMGFFIILVALEVIPADPKSFHAPHWVVGAAGGAFFLGGASILLEEVKNRAPQWAGTISLAQVWGAAVLITMFAAVGNWIAFGPGERHFTFQHALLLGPHAG